MVVTVKQGKTIEGIESLNSFAQKQVTETAQKAVDTLSGWNWSVKELYIHTTFNNKTGTPEGSKLVIIAEPPRMSTSFAPLRTQNFKQISSVSIEGKDSIRQNALPGRGGSLIPQGCYAFQSEKTFK